MIIEELLVWPDRWSLAAAPEMDALTESDALVEAALLAVRMDATTSAAWLLIDCRGALQIWMGNTALLAVHGLTELDWRSPPDGSRSWHTILDWQPKTSLAGFSCTVGTFWGSDLRIAGGRAEFYVGNVPGGDDPPPDFTSASDAEIRTGLALWRSDIDVIHASFL